MARPQRVSDAAIAAVIQELQLPHRSPSGLEVRTLLLQRFGTRASTDRIYRLLKAPPPPPPQPPAVDREESVRTIAAITAQRDAAVKRAELALYRERATQDRAAMQIDRLRQRLRALGVNPYED